MVCEDLEGYSPRDSRIKVQTTLQFQQDKVMCILLSEDKLRLNNK